MPLSSLAGVETLWIGSYVSCTGTHVLEQTVQGARHIRCIVLRSSTDGRWLLQGKSGKSGVARFVQYGDCIGTLLPQSDRAYTSPCRTSNEARGRRRAAHALSDAAYQRISSGRTGAVSPKLSRSDLVQCLFIGKRKIVVFSDFQRQGRVLLCGIDFALLPLYSSLHSFPPPCRSHRRGTCRVKGVWSA
jgi:hypothetical protein